MKPFFTVLFAFYTLLLAIIPCSDLFTIQSTKLSHQYISAINTINSNHSTQDETCSTLCVCSCCGNNVTANTELITIERPFPFGEKFSIYLYPCLNQSSSTIWQPPKIS